MFSTAGDLVVDPFLGSGTSLKASWIWGESSWAMNVLIVWLVIRRRLGKDSSKVSFENQALSMELAR